MSDRPTDEETLRDLYEVLLKNAEAAVAVGDMLAILCSYFAKTHPSEAAQMKSALEGLRRSGSSVPTDAFDALASRVLMALAGRDDWHLLSVRRREEVPPPSTDPATLRTRLRVIQGGRA